MDCIKIVFKNSHYFFQKKLNFSNVLFSVCEIFFSTPDGLEKKKKKLTIIDYGQVLFSAERLLLLFFFLSSWFIVFFST